MKKTITLFGTIAEIIVIIGLLFITVASFASRVPALSKAGLNFFTVTSGSMEPAIPTGSLLYAAKINPEDLKVDDIITFQKTSDVNEPVNVTHRIIEIDKTESIKTIGEGDQQQETKIINYDFITKGDANNDPDSVPVKAAEIVGLYKWHVPYLGYMAAFAQSPVGFMSLVVIPGLVLIIWEIISLVLYFKNKNGQAKDDEIALLKAELAKKQEK